ncbi:UMP kinase [Candidatus Pacearchaeota archaeon]|nr:UMP kinase [Candidatus Pacearchaeota archaeon]
MNGKKVMVISLGGSVIIPEGGMNIKFLEKFKKILRRYYRTHRFVVVCGGGSIARKYISVLRDEGKSVREQSLAGIRATRMNAAFLMQVFGEEANDSLPLNMEEVRDNLFKNKVVFCGALRYSQRSTSDSTSAQLANFLNGDLINITNVKGLYSSDPNKNKYAKFIPKINWKDFELMALKIKFAAGQHFVLDQNAAILIRKHKIPTYIIDDNTENLGRILKGEKFSGTLIRD